MRAKTYDPCPDLLGKSVVMPCFASSATTQNMLPGSCYSPVCCSLQDAPTSALSGSVNLSVKQGKGAKGMEVSVAVGPASARAKYSAADLRKLATKSLTLAEVAR